MRAPSWVGALSRSWLIAATASSYRFGSVIPDPTKLTKAACSRTGLKPSKSAFCRRARASKSTNRGPAERWVRPMPGPPSVVEDSMGRSCPVSSFDSRDVRVTSPEPSSVRPWWKSQLKKADMGIPFPLDQRHGAFPKPSPSVCGSPCQSVHSSRGQPRPTGKRGVGAERAQPRAARARSWRPRPQLRCVAHLAQQDDGALDRDLIALALWRVDLDPVLVLEVVDARSEEHTSELQSRQYI